MQSLMDQIYSDFSVFSVTAVLIFLILGLAITLLLDPSSNIFNPTTLVSIISTGAVVFTALSVVIGVVTVSRYTIFFSTILSLGVILRRRDRLKLDSLDLTQVTFLIITAVTFYIFWNYGSVRLWSPIGDVATAHSPLVERIQHYGHLPLSKSELGILYPPGFHLFSSTLNTLYHFHSPQIVFFSMILIAGLIPLMNYLIAANFSGSPVLGLAAFILSWYFHPSKHLDRFLLGPLFNGTYPFLFGVFIVQSIILLVSRYEAVNSDNIRDFAVHSGIMFFSLTCVYPTFLFVVVSIYAVLLRYYYRVELGLFTELARRNRFFLCYLSGGVLLLTLAKPDLANFVQYFSTKFAYTGQDVISVVSPESYAYKVNLDIYVSGLLGVISIISSLIGLSSRKVRESRVFLMFAPIMFITVVSSLVEPLNSFLFFFTPNRSMMITKILGVMVLLYSVKEYTEYIIYPTGRRERHQVSFSPEVRKMVFYTVILVACLTLTLPSIKQQSKRTFKQDPSNKFSNDFDAFIWVAENSNEGDVILASPTWVSWYGQSFTQAEYVHHQYSRMMDTDRDRSLWLIWLFPGEEEFVHSQLQKYGVKYLVVTSADYQFDFAQNWSGKRSPALYLYQFDHYEFLNPMYSKGSVAVYSVS